MNVVCLKWGTKYSSLYVNKLYSMVQRNLTIPHRFICFTDDINGINPEIECKPIIPTSEHAVGWWHKISFFAEKIDDLSGTMLFLDLDVVIVNNIDDFFTYEPNKFCIVLDTGFRHKTIYNSSIFRMEIGKYSYIYEDYLNNSRTIMRSMLGDQDLITQKINNPSLWPAQWVPSYKNDLTNHGRKPAIITPETKIIIFHGHPKPNEAIMGGFVHYKPCTELANHWR